MVRATHDVSRLLLLSGYAVAEFVAVSVLEDDSSGAPTRRQSFALVYGLRV